MFNFAIADRCSSRQFAVSRVVVVMFERSCSKSKRGKVVFGSLYGGELVITTSYSELGMAGRRQLQSFNFQARWGIPPWRGMEIVSTLHSRTRPAVPTSLVVDEGDRGSYPSVSTLMPFINQRFPTYTV